MLQEQVIQLQDELANEKNERNHFQLEKVKHIYMFNFNIIIIINPYIYHLFFFYFIYLIF